MGIKLELDYSADLLTCCTLRCLSEWSAVSRAPLIIILAGVVCCAMLAQGLGGKCRGGKGKQCFLFIMQNLHKLINYSGEMY